MQTHGCFITPLTDDTNLEATKKEILQAAQDLKIKIHAYVKEIAVESAEEQGTKVSSKEILYGNAQVLNWALKQIELHYS